MKKESIVFILIIFMIISLIVLIPMAVAGVIINEVMPNPIDGKAEWVELYSIDIINLTGWKLDTQKQNYTFNNVIIEDYLIITKNKTAFLLLWPIINESKIINWSRMGLVNTGDNVTLYNISLKVDNTTYPSFSLTPLKNSTWARNETNFWATCNPTPGQENNCQEPEPEPECLVDEDCNENEICEEDICVAHEDEEKSSLKITDYDDEATFGDIIDVKLKIYRGNTGKYAVYIRVEDESKKDVSEESILHILTKYIDYKVKIPVQLKMNCNEKYQNDTYFIIVEGLDEKITEEIKISGKSPECEDNINEGIILEQSFEVNEENENEQTQISNKVITGQTVVESEGSAVLKITPYLLALLSLFITLYIIKLK